MKNNINDVYILTPPELTVIAAGKDIHGIFSIQEELLQMDENMVCQALNHLYQQKFIQNSEGEGFILNEDLEKMLAIISNAHTVVLIRSFNNILRVKSIYIENGLVAIEQNGMNTNAIRLYEIPEKELIHFLKEDLRNEEKQYKQVLDEERLLYAALKNSSTLQGYELDSLGNVTTMIECINHKKDKVNYRLLVKQEEKEKQFLCYRQEKKQICTFNEEESLDMVVDMIEEALHDIS